MTINPRQNDHRDRVLSESALDALGTLPLGWIGFRRFVVGFSILWICLWICLRFLGLNVVLFSQDRVGRICWPLLG